MHMHTINDHSDPPHTCARRPHLSGLLDRAEWIKFAAPFFNKEPEGNSVFSAIESRFEAVVKDVETFRCPSCPTWRLRVAFIQAGGSCCVTKDNPAGSTWGPSISIPAYKQEIVVKAGGRNVDPTIADTWCPRKDSKYQCANLTMMYKVTTPNPSILLCRRHRAAPAAAPLLCPLLVLLISD